MRTVDLSNWRFSFGGSDPKLIGSELFREPTIVEFATPLEFLLHLADDDGANDAHFKSGLEHRLEKDAAAKEWHRQRTMIGATTHFKAYRKNPHYERYHSAAAAIALGQATDDQHKLVRGLNAE